MIASTLKIGLFAIGLDTYWQQFDGLKERLEGYLFEVDKKIASVHPHIVNAGLADTIDKAFETGKLFRKEDVGIIFLYVSTYALSSTVLPVVQHAKVPVIVLNLSPGATMDFEALNQMNDRKKMTGEWLSFCSACSVPEIANVFSRTGIKFHEITGLLHDEESFAEIKEWIEAAKVAHIMSYNRMGCMGHYYSGMLDIYSDLTQHYRYFGGHFEIIEVDELSSLRDEVSDLAIQSRIELFYDCFDVQPDCSNYEMERAAKTSVALDMLVEKYKLGSLAYYYKGSPGSKNYDTVSSVILGNSLLTARGIPVAGEYEIKNAQAMKIMDSFGAGGSFTEYYAIDYTEDAVLMGHDGPGHTAIAESKTIVRPLQVYHGKAGNGLSVEMSVKKGPVTLLSVVQKIDGKLFFLVAEGKSVSGPIMQIGNTNSRYKFNISAKQFVNLWNSYAPAHHCAVGTGHIASKIEKLGELLGIETVQIC